MRSIDESKEGCWTIDVVFLLHDGGGRHGRNEASRVWGLWDGGSIPFAVDE